MSRGNPVHGDRGYCSTTAIVLFGRRIPFLTPVLVAYARHAAKTTSDVGGYVTTRGRVPTDVPRVI